MKKIDVVCPIYYVDLDIFEKCLESWYSNIPIRMLYIGLGKNNDDLKVLLWDYPDVVIIET